MTNTPNPLIEAVKANIQVTIDNLTLILDVYQQAHDHLCEDPKKPVSEMSYDSMKSACEFSATMVAFTKQQHEAANA